MEQAIAVFAEKIWTLEKNGTIGDYCTMKSGFAFKSSWWTDKGVRDSLLPKLMSGELDVSELDI